MALKVQQHQIVFYLDVDVFAEMLTYQLTTMWKLPFHLEKLWIQNTKCNDHQHTLDLRVAYSTVYTV